MNQVEVHEPTLPGLLPDKDALDVARSFTTVLDGHEFLIDRMLDQAERDVLTRRASALSDVLMPLSKRRSDQVAAASVIAALLVGYGVGRKDRAAAETVTVYLEHLKSVPLFAIRAACEDVKAGRVFDVDRRTGNRTPLDPDFPPSTVRLRAVAEKHVKAVEDEKFVFDRVLRAKRTLPPPIPEAERRIVAARFKELTDDMHRREAQQDLDRVEARARTDEEARARGDRLIEVEYRSAGLEPVRNGAGMLVSLSSMKLAGWTVEETIRGGVVGRALVAPAEVR